MSTQLADLLDRFEPDNWRRQSGFSPEVDEVNRVLFATEGNAQGQIHAVNTWIQKQQPCLFGKAAAGQGAIHYCLLGEREIREGDECVRKRIADAHLRWTRETFEGRSSSFVIVAISERIATAAPNSEVLEFAKILASLYLQEDSIEPDQIYHDSAFLAVPDQVERVFKWKAGVNYFSAHGDRRWWQDHRIPGGLGFSTNSVGHLAKSGKLLAVLDSYLEQLGVDPNERLGPKIDSLAKALVVAMQTIDNASESVSGKATKLLPLPADPSQLPVECCPFRLPQKLEDKNFCAYRGYYHTDFTLPSLYFRPDVERPTAIDPIDNLDFTYLFHRSPSNPAYFTMGEGVLIRASEGGQPQVKRDRMDPSEVLIENEPLLVQALGLGD